MAILWAGATDAYIGCWNGKYTYSFWRPVTAIQAGGGDPDLLPDSDWLPLGTTANHPEYPAAHGCVTGAVSHLIEGYFGTPKVHIVVESLVFPDGMHTHVFEDTHDLFREVVWARIYSGFHFRHSPHDDRELGRQLAHQLLRDHFHVLNQGVDAPKQDR